MQYELYLKYNTFIDIGLKDGCWGDLCQHTRADVIRWTPKKEADEEGENTTIGFMKWATYNQCLAMRYGVNMLDVPLLSMQNNSKALFDLDYTNITQETIKEIGVASNPNIVLLIHFGIMADYRNKGLGEEVLKGFIEQMKGSCGYIVIAHNEPPQFNPKSLYPRKGIELDNLEKDPEKAQWKLNAFWQRCGFKQFKDYENVFICNVDQAVAQYFKAKTPAI